jgi:Leucine-rich repeat (LRR) protein
MATNEQPPELVADAFPAALVSLPPELWEIFLMNSTCVADRHLFTIPRLGSRTILLRMTSKRVKKLVDKVRPPAVVCWRRSFLEEERNGTAAEKLLFVFRQLSELSARCRITTLELFFDAKDCHLEGGTTLESFLKDEDGRFDFDHPCKITGQYAERLAGVLAECPALACLNLRYNRIEADGAGRLAGVLAQCPALAHLDLGDNNIGSVGAQSLAPVLPQCPVLADHRLHTNQIGQEGANSHAQVIAQCRALTRLDLDSNDIKSAGAQSLASVLTQCPLLAHLNLCRNSIKSDGAKSVAEVLTQCTALTHLDLRYNLIREAGADSFAGVLGQCTVLTSLHLEMNYISDASKQKLQQSWCGRADGLFL